MKLQKQVSRKVGDKEYEKSWVVIPQEILKKLSWKTGQELMGEIKGDKLIIKKKKEDGNKETEIINEWT
jgi:bifunctional DNA-binding transcriptional regulator/antitoxin component of YhaV-PrlF toxin-antitoxin module